MNNIYMYARRTGRTFARRLGRELGILTTTDTGFRHTGRHVQLLNWGNSIEPQYHEDYSWIGNTPAHIALASNKIDTFRALAAADVEALAYTTSPQQAAGWLQVGRGVYVRHRITGHSGQGLEYIDPRQGLEQAIPDAALYTRDFGTPFKEYRVHVYGGTIIDVTQKRRLNPSSIEERDMDTPDERTRLQVRTYANGWVFTRHGIKYHDDIGQLAVEALEALDGMHMGAVDIIAHWSGDTLVLAAVVEVNSAPAIRSPSLLEKYVNVIKAHLEEL